MANFTKIAKAAGLGLALTLAAGQSQAAFINVGGVVWDPDQTFAFPLLTDFQASASLIETVTTGVGSTVTGYGSMNRLNSFDPNQASFCPGCELTFAFTMDTLSITPTSGVSADFVFTNLVVNLYVDHTPDLDLSSLATGAATATDGALWLSLVGNGNLTGDGDNIGTGSDDGDGSALLDVTGGLAQSNFDTNTRVNGADFVFTSSFQPIVPGQAGSILTGDVQLTGNSIPEPGSLALLGLGLLGLGTSVVKRRKA